MAIDKNSLELVKLLVENGANVNNYFVLLFFTTFFISKLDSFLIQRIFYCIHGVHY